MPACPRRGSVNPPNPLCILGARVQRQQLAGLEHAPVGSMADDLGSDEAAPAQIMHWSVRPDAGDPPELSGPGVDELMLAVPPKQGLRAQLDGIEAGRLQGWACLRPEHGTSGPANVGRLRVAFFLGTTCT